MSAAGLLLLAAGATSTTVLLAVTACGAGFGAAQSSSLALMMDDAETADFPAISAAWNAAYDVGLGAGPLAFAVVAAHTSTPVGPEPAGPGAVRRVAARRLQTLTRRRACPEMSARHRPATSKTQQSPLALNRAPAWPRNPLQHHPDSERQDSCACRPGCPASQNARCFVEQDHW